MSVPGVVCIQGVCLQGGSQWACVCNTVDFVKSASASNMIASATLNSYRPQRSWAKLMFLQVSVILFTGGGVCQVTLPSTRYPQDQVHLPRDQVQHPGTRYSPRGPGTLLEPGTPPNTRYTLLDQVRQPGPGTPPGPGTLTRTRYTPRTRYPPIWSTIGRYASYWNAFLFSGKFQ